jgi:hypothetical protein
VWERFEVHGKDYLGLMAHTAEFSNTFSKMPHFLQVTGSEKYYLQLVGNGKLIKS